MPSTAPDGDTTTDPPRPAKRPPQPSTKADAQRAEHAGYASIDDAAAWAHWSERMYEYINAGRVETVYDGAKQLIVMASLKAMRERQHKPH